MSKFLLVDGMAILFRAYFATSFTGKIRRTSEGLPVNGVHGFVRYFMNAIETYKPTHVICFWDMGSKTFRTEQYSDYKANRPSAPEDLVPQFDLVKELVDSFDVPNVGIVGFEADDCIGTVAKQFSRQGHDVIVLTGDHDMLQLIDDHIHIAIMKKGIGNYQLYTTDYLYEEKQLTPKQIIDVKALMGDTADNYPGVKGIGEKTAYKLIQQYNDIEGLLANLDELSKSIKTKIEEHLDMLHLSRELATINCDVPLEELVVDHCIWQYDEKKVREQFDRLEFNSLIKLVTSTN